MTGQGVSTSLHWPGDHRAGEAFGDLAYARAMLAVEVGWLRVLSRGGLLPASSAEALAAVELDAADVAEIAAAAEGSGNPVVALLGVLRSRVGDEQAARWLHRGLTSQDVVDTALVLCARATLEQLSVDLRGCVRSFAALAQTHADSPQVGRTLTQHAVPITFGLKVSGWLHGVLAAAADVDRVRTALPVQCGGAAGTLAAVAELAAGAGSGSSAADAVGWSARLADELGLRAAPPWHTQRGVVTGIGDALVTVTDALGHVAADVAVLSRPEVAEVSEPAAAGRGGSSTMPQKRNPVLAVLIRRAALAAPLLGAQLHLAAATAVDERPDGAWHAEWEPLALLARHALTAASQTAELAAGLQVHADTMAARVAGALPETLAEQQSIRELLGVGPAEPDVRRYLGASRLLVDEAVDAARRWLAAGGAG